MVILCSYLKYGLMEEINYIISAGSHFKYIKEEVIDRYNVPVNNTELKNLNFLGGTTFRPLKKY